MTTRTLAASRPGPVALDELITLADAVRDVLAVPEPAGGQWADYYHVVDMRARYVRDALTSLVDLRDADPDAETIARYARSVATEIAALHDRVRLNFDTFGLCPTCGESLRAGEEDGEKAECPWCDSPSAASENGGQALAEGVA